MNHNNDAFIEVSLCPMTTQGHSFGLQFDIVKFLILYSKCTLIETERFMHILSIFKYFIVNRYYVIVKLISVLGTARSGRISYYMVNGVS